jgi:hypothetical protein
MWSGISEHIVQETEARENFGWDINDINLFLASELVMGLSPQPQIHDYFMQDRKGIFGSLWMQQHFTQVKWSQLHSHIHFEPRDLIQALRLNGQNLWSLGQVVIVDEMMVPFTGRWKGIQFVRGKPHDTGLKFYCLADKYSYLWDFWLYEGHESERSGKPIEIVQDFVNNATREQHKPHIVVVDSYYGSLKLAQILHAKKFGVLFSCKADRPSYLFSSLLQQNLAKGEFQYINNYHFSAMTYYDKAKINLLTNLFPVQKMIHDSSGVKSLPQALYWYRKWLGGVDNFDRWLHLYMQKHRNIKWTQALLVALLKIAVGNTNVIATNMGLSTNLRETTLQLIDHLSKSHTLREDHNRPVYAKRKNGWGHFPEKLEKQQPCSECNNTGKTSKAKFKCKICNVPLHSHCFANYHEK